MITENYSSFLHWDYLVSLSKELETCSRYIEFTESNYSTFSTELTKLYLSSCAETDAVLKQICKRVAPKRNSSNIDHYRRTISEYVPAILSEVILLFGDRLSLCPFENWKNDQNPIWWQSHNDVKHTRDEFYKEANLENTVRAISGLMVSCLYLYSLKKTGEADLNAKKEFIRRIHSHPTILTFNNDYYPKALRAG